MGANYGQDSTMDVCEVKEEVEKSIRIIAPVSGAKWYYGKDYNIMWYSEGVNKVNIQLVKGSNGWHIAYNVDASLGSYNIEADQFDPGDDYYVEIWDAEDPTISAQSGYFDIVSALGLEDIEDQLATVSKTISELLEKIKELIKR